LNQSTLRSPSSKGLSMENMTQLGCGYDFRLSRQGTRDFLAVEVKGIREKAGSVLLTPKEYEAATELQNNFYLFVVKNFQKEPYHELFLNPIAGKLQFTRMSECWFRCHGLPAFKEQNQMNQSEA